MRTQMPVNESNEPADTAKYAPKPISPTETVVMTVKILAIGGGVLGTLWWLSQ
ncbi:MAG: hypothetical protein JST11_31295 [Acidobacteria bacterium]|nr:hypothetical protein [Acidobacteriota bacterium]